MLPRQSVSQVNQNGDVQAVEAPTAISATRRVSLSPSASVKPMCLFIHPNNKLPGHHVRPGTTVARCWRHDNKTHGLNYPLQLLSWENLTRLRNTQLWFLEASGFGKLQHV